MALALALGLTGLIALVPRPTVDLGLREAANAIATPGVLAVAGGLTHGGTWRALAPLGLLLLLAPHMRRCTWLWGVALAGGPVVADAWQHLVARPRPAGHALGFPSGHATAVAVFAAVALHALGDPRLGRAPRRVLRAGVVAFAIGVGATRVLLGAHWPTDVLVGFAVGGAIGMAAVWWDVRQASALRPGRRRSASVLLAIAVALLAAAQAACDRTPASAPSARLVVAATFYPLYEFSRQIVGDRGDVVTLVPPGVEPHDWEPSPRELVEIRKARVLVYNGAGLEPWVTRLLRDADAAQLAVNTTDGMALLTAPGGGHDRAPAAGHAASAGRATAVDPHVWLDPLLALTQVQAIRAAVERADPAGAAVYRANAEGFAAELRALDARYTAGLRDCARRELVTAHAAFGYLTRRYGLVQIPVLGVSPDTEPNPGDLARLVQLARRHQVRYVFAETLLGRRLTETLAREVGAEVLVLNPIEGLTPEEQAAGKRYLGVMDDNLRTLRTGLGCK